MQARSHLWGGKTSAGNRILSDLAVEFSAKFYGHKAENENQGRNRIK